MNVVAGAEVVGKEFLRELRRKGLVDIRTSVREKIHELTRSPLCSVFFGSRHVHGCWAVEVHDVSCG